MRDLLIEIHQCCLQPKAKTSDTKLAQAAETGGCVGKIGFGMGLSKRLGLQVGVLVNGGGDEFLTSRWGYSEFLFHCLD